ncbi:MAG: hypothetical protein WDM81_15690 [Rhizomicrobium sp.]
MRFRAFALVLLLGWAAQPASAAGSDFLGVWTAATPDASGLARIVIAPGSGDRLDHPCLWPLPAARLRLGRPSGAALFHRGRTARRPRASRRISTPVRRISA